MNRDDVVAQLTAERYGYSQWVRHRQCGAKIRYTTRLDARRTVLLHWRDGDDAHEYRCPYGEHWHVSTRPEEASA